MSIEVDIIILHTSSAKTRSFLRAEKSTVPHLRVSRCFVTATPRILGILTILDEKLTEYETNNNQTAGGTQLLLLDYNIADNRFYLRHIHLLLKNS